MTEIKNFEQKALRIFQKNGGDGEGVKVFDHFPSQTKEKILNDFQLETDEKPIIAGSNNGKSYLLLTDKRLLQAIEDAVAGITLSDIKEVNVPNEEVSPNSKKRWKTLEVVDFGSKSTSFEIEEGLPFFGVWNVLLFVKTNNGQNKN